MSPARTVTRRPPARQRRRTAAGPGARRRPARRRPRTAKGRRRLRLAALWPPLLVVLVVLIGLAWDAEGQDVPLATAQCTLPATRMTLTGEQIANARTIARVAYDRGLPERAVVIALATAMQESRLRNLDYGDRDSLGLFQQRPSQGWGTPEQIRDPVYSATAFYNALVKVKNWDSLPVNDAAQKVQRSGTPQAYAKWEDQARFVSSILTGETPAAFVCRFSEPQSVATRTSITEALTREFGAASFGATDNARGWSEASWLVGHAHEYGIDSVEFDGF